MNKIQILILISALFTISISQTSCNSTQQDIDEEKEVVNTLNKFLRAFENGDFETMEALMTNDAYIFPRAIMSNDSLGPIDNVNYRRMNGLDPQMKQVINSIRESGKQPPFMKLEPKDLKITILKEAAIVTFHLENGKSLSRRTIVLGENNDTWKIVHIHPSNVVSSEYR
ncbi:YybH family protein [Winogradskyella sp. PG-2]|uniref:YybH family protein n=1 Tax=Winogradskyella sp. PG-2 TaxID=754409 RepID=UPI000696EFC4|nr:nuclear transport factor 2 family protein [Winogradskyella sp. PG-2]